MESPLMRKIFKFLNKFFMVPLFRMGFGALVGNPLTGYIMVLKTIGRVSGKIRYAPVNYAILGGCVYCTAGFGKASHWYKNLKAHPEIEVILPGRTIAGTVEEVEDPGEKLTAFRQIMKNGGFAGFSLGFNPFTIPDEDLAPRMKEYPVMRIRPSGVGSGPADAGGWMWFLWVIVALGLILWFVIS